MNEHLRRVGKCIDTYIWFAHYGCGYALAKARIREGENGALVDSGDVVDGTLDLAR